MQLLFKKTNKTKIDQLNNIFFQIKVDDTMTVSPMSFISASGLSLHVNNNGKQFEHREISTIRLNDIQPAVESWPAIENPLTMTFNEGKAICKNDRKLKKKKINVH